MRARSTYYLVLLLTVAHLVQACAPQGASPPAVPSTDTLHGVVRDENGPVPAAVVRVQTTDIATRTDAQGRFTLGGLAPGESVSLTAWAPGYYIGGGEEVRPGEEVTLTLEALAAADNPAYAWLSAFTQADQEGNCERCHAATEASEGPLPFDEWQRDPHSRSAQNPRFLTMYSGTDVQGRQSPLTRYGNQQDYGRFPMPPDLSRPYYGPGYKLDFPASAGNCAACHLPAAAVRAPYGTDPRAVEGVGAEGVTCDFCHKVWDVRLSPQGLPYGNMPGVLSLAFRRPPEGHQFFAGPLDDVAPGEDTYVPLYTQSQYCAACHFGNFWDVRIYNSFGEWLESPYSDPETGRTCQDCHMPPGKNDHFVRFDKGGRRRNPESIFSHDMTVTPDLLRQAVRLDVATVWADGRLTVIVTVTNRGAGHHVPTDSPLRQMLLLVQATDANGNLLPLTEGPVLPEWAGEGDPSQGYYAGLPGRLYAKTLQEIWTEVTPSGAYWNPSRILEDTRIPALASDRSIYVFAPAEGAVSVKVRLLYRRAFPTLIAQKGWEVPIIVLAERTLRVSGE